jgi:hypothetical protein
MPPVGYRGAAKMVPVPDEKRAIELVRKRVPVKLAEAVAEVAENQFGGGDVRRLGKKADLDEGQ